MNKNPLTGTVLAFAIGDGYTMWQSVVSHTANVFTAIAWVQGIILLVLYLKRSPFAGNYQFYSTIPFFPIYFGLKLAGVLTPRPMPGVYLVAAIIYAAALPLLWKLKRDYDLYLAAEARAPVA